MSSNWRDTGSVSGSAQGDSRIFRLQAREDVNPASILEAAADYMEVHGWTKGVSENALGEVCVQGAIWRGVGVNMHAHPGYDRNLHRLFKVAEKTLCKAMDTTATAAWNDLICKSKYEAVDALRLAAKLAQTSELVIH